MNHPISFPKKKSPKRKGRGISAGQGKTAGRGTKGQNARSGSKLRPTFEGGQTPMIKKLPKIRGFKSTRSPIQEVTITQLNRLGEKTINRAVLSEASIISTANKPVKLIGNTEATKAFSVEVDAVSKGAKQSIESAGGSVTLKSVHAQ